CSSRCQDVVSIRLYTTQHINVAEGIIVFRINTVPKTPSFFMFRPYIHIVRPLGSLKNQYSQKLHYIPFCLKAKSFRRKSFGNNPAQITTWLIREVTSNRKSDNMGPSLLSTNGPLDAASTEDIAREAFSRVISPCIIHVNLDSVAHNVRLLKRMAGPNTELMGVVKGGAYGSGILPVVGVLKDEGCTHFAVATVGEGVYLRKHAITEKITTLGNLVSCEIPAVLQYQLMPSVGWINCFSTYNKDQLMYPDGTRLHVNINIDTGMSRFGVQPEDLPELINNLENLQVGIHSIYTHLQSSITEKDENQKQVDIYLKAIEPYKNRGIKFHVSATTGCVQNLCTDLDYIRPGGAITGLSSCSDRESASRFAEYGFRPAFSVIARPAFFKQLPAGRFVGYDGTYETRGEEWLANITTGWSDGLSRKLSNTGAVKRLLTGEKCPIVGRVSMDSIIIKLPEAPNQDELFKVITDDFDDETSAVGIGRMLGAAVYEVPGNWSTRLPRVYSHGGKVTQICQALEYTN
ncbi:unnamed protein product, partial [Meganyctiphanes norvegica]